MTGKKSYFETLYLALGYYFMPGVTNGGVFVSLLYRNHIPRAISVKNKLKDILPAEEAPKGEGGLELVPEGLPQISGIAPLTADRETQLFHSFLSGNDAAFKTLYD